MIAAYSKLKSGYSEITIMIFLIINIINGKGIRTRF